MVVIYIADSGMVLDILSKICFMDTQINFSGVVAPEFYFNGFNVTIQGSSAYLHFHCYLASLFLLKQA